MQEKNTGIWVYLSLASLVMLSGTFVLWRQREVLVEPTPSQVAVPSVPTSSAPRVALAVNPENTLVKNISDITFSKEVEKSSKPVLVDFWATWCGPCQMFGPIVDQVAEDYKGRLKVCRVDVDQNPGLSQTFQVRAIPTSLLFKNGKIVKSWVGLVSGEDLKVEVDKILKRAKKTTLVKS